MLGLSSPLAQIRRTEGNIQLPDHAACEVLPWADTMTGCDKVGRTRPASRRQGLLIRTRYTKNKTSQSSKGLLSPAPQRHIAARYAKYQELSRDIKGGHVEMRLLKLLPSQPEEPLSCELIHVKISNPPEYEALSYCWGDPAPTNEMNCDRTPISITSNLAAALEVFRRQKSPRLLWVDAVCINQTDTAEKEYQVPLMGQIYRQASAVQVWLGNDTPENTCGTAFTILENLKDMCMRFGWDIDFTYLIWHQKLGEYGLPDVADPSWKAVRHLVEMPWFTRTWIIQDVVLSRKAYLQCGNRSLPWIDFCIGFLSLSPIFLQYRPDIIPSVSSYNQTTQLILSYHEAGHSSGLDFLALLENHRAARASDARDKIYGFLGLYELTSIQRAHRIVPDYHRPVEGIFVDAAREIVENSPTLDILGVTRREQASRMAGLPSWVPDWSTSDFASSLSCRTAGGNPMFSFDAAYVSQVPKHAIVHGDTSLELEGFSFDEIVKVGCMSDPFLKQDAESGHLRASTLAVVVNHAALYLDWLTLSGGLARNSGRQYPNGESVMDAFVRTIYLDDFSNGYTAEQAVDYYRSVYVPSYALRKPWFGDSKVPVGKRIETLFTGTFFKLVGPAPLKALAELISRYERRLKANVYISYRNLSEPREQYDMIVDAGIRAPYRRMFCTKSGYIGLGPRSSRKGDRVFLVKGSRTPLLLRRQPEGEEAWELLGDCYVHGVMHGEMFHESRCEPICVV